MASKFQKTINSIKNVLGGGTAKTVLGNGKFQSAENKLSAPLANAHTKHELHLSSRQHYPQAEPLPLPINIDPTESTRFSPQRARDITSTAIATNLWNTIDITVDTSMKTESASYDPHVESYDCTGAVSLSSSMQSNVPSPFGGMNKFTHLNMPGGQWEQSSKWMSHDLHSSHYTNLRREARKDWSKSDFSEKSGDKDKGTFVALPNTLHGGMPFSKSTFIANSYLNVNYANFMTAINKTVLSLNANANLCLQTRQYSSNKFVPSSDGKTETKDKLSGNVEKSDNNQTEQVSEEAKTIADAPVSKKEMLKKAVKEYGSTVIIFHVGISLVSLGLFYQLVASGLDVISILEYIGMANSTVTNNITAGASTFVIAYAVHKVFAPIRISITLVSAPLLVRYLRKRGILKAPKSTGSPSK